MHSRIIRPSLFTAENNNEFCVRQSSWFNSCTFDSDGSPFFLFLVGDFPSLFLSLCCYHTRPISSLLLPSLQWGNSSLGINPLQIRLKHWVIIWPTGCSDQRRMGLHVCVRLCPCLFVYLWHVREFKAVDLGGALFLFPGTKWAIPFLSFLCLFEVQLGGWGMTNLTQISSPPSTSSLPLTPLPSLPSPLAPRLEM